MPLIIEATLAKGPDERIFFSLYEAKRGSQEPILRIRRSTREPEVLIRPMEDPELEQLMTQALLGDTFSERFQEALRDFAEGLFQAGIDYAKRQKE